MNKEKTDNMKTKKEKFLELAYSKFGISANEEITFEQVFEIIDELESEREEKEYEPYFGWCDVEGCDNEGANGGGCWRETGYWTVCSDHSYEHREGKPQPKMKQSSIDREKTRDSNGYLTTKIN